MFKELKELYHLLTRKQKKRLLGLQFLVVLMAFAEIAGVLSIGPFMSIVGDMQRLEGEGRIAQIYQQSGFTDPGQFLFWMGVAVIVILGLASLVSMYTVWRLSIYGAYIGAELSARLYKHYMYQPWLFHANTSSSQLTKQIKGECQRVTGGVIKPFMKMNAKLIMMLFMMTAIFIYNPVVAITGLVLFSVSYLGLYHAIRRRLTKKGKTISKKQRESYQLLSEGFGGVKDALILGRQPVFTNRFEAVSHKMARAKGTSHAMSEMPRYAMELMAFGAVIFLVLYLLASHRGDLGSILPVLSVYALAGFKMLPAFQQVFTSVSTMRSNMPAFEAIKQDLVASREKEQAPDKRNTKQNLTPLLKPKHSIKLKDVEFSYPGKKEPALNGLNINIPVNSVIGLVGASGSGKSTAVDLLLGLIEPDKGQLLIDEQPIDSTNRRAWQNTLGFVSQSIFLADSSIRENIAFGLPPESIDNERVNRAVSMAHLEDLVAELPEGIETRVGERGVQLSGGQRQRIGIARALYIDADILILDEATSALDGITEQLVMEAINDFSGRKTIIMIAHRLATVKKCNLIYFLEKGRVIDQGSYHELAESNPMFKRMSELA